jgi:predicted nuclease of predicted toxin-antitoxin system
MLVKLLLDENLSPTVAARLRIEGFDVVHVRDRKLSGKSDHHVLERAYSEDRILVTSNAEDFRKLAAAREIHPGIVLIVDGDLLRDEQEKVLRKTISVIQQEHVAGRDLVNRVLRIGREPDWNLTELSRATADH